MKQVDFRKAIAASLDEKLDRFLPIYVHSGKDIFLKVRYPSGSSSLNEALIDYVYIDKRKKRVFYVGKSDERRDASFFRRRPMLMKLKDFYNWASSKSVRCDDYDVYFAWNYDSKDEVLYDYIPLDSNIELDSNASSLKSIVFAAVEDAKAFRFKARNLHESILRLESRKNG